MKINKLNYEVYAIDYIDGTLSKDLKAEMESFLNTHPDIAKDISMMSDMQLVPDTSIKFRAKNDLKKPMSFSILSYMNWIVPVSLSIAFMIAYPSIRTLWHSDDAAASDVEWQEKEQQAPVFEPNHPISSVEVYGQSNATIEKQTNKETKKQANIYNKVVQSSVRFDAMSEGNFIDVVSNEMISNSENNAITSASINSAFLANNETDIVKNDEEKSIIDFGNRSDLNTETDLEQLDFLSAYPNHLSPDYSLNSKRIEEILTRKKGFLPYMSFTIVPLSIGNDMAKTTNINTDNQLIRNLPVANDNEIIIGNPRSYGIEMDVHLSELFKVGTGFMVANRNILYSTIEGNNTSNTDLGIQYNTYSVPFMAALKMPLGSSGLNTLNFKGGAVISWMGNMNYQANHNGSIDLEGKNTASLFNTTGLSSELITTDDKLTFVPALQFGLEYTRQLPRGQVSFGLDYNRQMSNINSISVWDYDIDTQFRSNQTSYNMRYESVAASVKYTLPYRCYLKRK